uniref:Selenoprotein F n=1 Tax=Tetraselmis sp. GSL018 TaxID=582737 RepID=A0A061S342_9CHLO|mmetsp:Transcript_37888/g.89982  ORF Transcript_37888/g.89982 Transcript_37888/m.89982 type:complete len:161 (+) Transcript_37888:92-574(+)|eukprot:CAMPEP_0177598484 /NCGR_PEP_ID=MMETSP0419_2-20121207/12385_1 /TAXON_ID=582737 /ORGANISM="Tetraselmis sp., Strain GSL018" /LENGTH=160 /DNA_ID=CAMNT_0019090955 /DNA_START=46 /DNA_END=528 /DNA_ORIENTATION=-
MLRSVLSMLCSLSIFLLAQISRTDSKNIPVDPVDCESLGFTRLALCSDCDVLAEYVKEEDIVSDCRKCCAAESQQTGAKYTSATLEICKHRLPAYPHVEGFLKSATAKNLGEKLKVKFRFGAYPKLILNSSSGKAGDSVRVDNWKTEHFEEFLQDKLSNV